MSNYLYRLLNSSKEIVSQYNSLTSLAIDYLALREIDLNCSAETLFFKEWTNINHIILRDNK